MFSVLRIKAPNVLECGVFLKFMTNTASILFKTQRIWSHHDIFIYEWNYWYSEKINVKHKFYVKYVGFPNVQKKKVFIFLKLNASHLGHIII